MAELISSKKDHVCQEDVGCHDNVFTWLLHGGCHHHDNGGSDDSCPISKNDGCPPDHGKCHHRDAPVWLTDAEVKALMNVAACLSKKEMSAYEVHKCTGNSVSPKIAVCVYVPSINDKTEGDCHVGEVGDATPASIVNAKALAITAFNNSSPHIATSTAAYEVLTDTSDGANSWSGYDGVAGHKANARFPGGIPLYRGGKVVGALGVGGTSPIMCHKIALKTAGESFAAPQKLVDHMTKMLNGDPGLRIADDNKEEVNGKGKR